MKTLLKWFCGLVLLAVVLAVVFLLSLDTILRLVAVHNIRTQTGMDVEIGKFHLGLLEPVVTIKDLKIHNPPSFGGTPFLNIPEIHVEYDRAALAKNQIHITLLRFNLGDLVLVRNEKGKINLSEMGITNQILAIAKAIPSKTPVQSSDVSKVLKQRTGLDFTSIEALNVSIGTLRYIDLKEARNTREQKIGIDNFVMKNVKSPADLAGLVVLIALRGGDFFTGVLGAGGNLK